MINHFVIGGSEKMQQKPLTTFHSGASKRRPAAGKVPALPLFRDTRSPSANQPLHSHSSNVTQLITAPVNERRDLCAPNLRASVGAEGKVSEKAARGSALVDLKCLVARVTQLLFQSHRDARTRRHAH